VLMSSLIALSFSTNSFSADRDDSRDIDQNIHEAEQRKATTKAREAAQETTRISEERRVSEERKQTKVRHNNDSREAEKQEGVASEWREITQRLTNISSEDRNSMHNSHAKYKSESTGIALGIEAGFPLLERLNRLSIEDFPGIALPKSIERLLEDQGNLDSKEQPVNEEKWAEEILKTDEGKEVEKSLDVEQGAKDPEIEQTIEGSKEYKEKKEAWYKIVQTHNSMLWDIKDDKQEALEYLTAKKEGYSAYIEAKAILDSAMEVFNTNYSLAEGVYLEMVIPYYEAFKTERLAAEQQRDLALEEANLYTGEEKLQMIETLWAAFWDAWNSAEELFEQAKEPLLALKKEMQDQSWQTYGPAMMGADDNLKVVEIQILTSMADEYDAVYDNYDAQLVARKQWLQEAITVFEEHYGPTEWGGI